MCGKYSSAICRICDNKKIPLSEGSYFWTFDRALLIPEASAVWILIIFLNFHSNCSVLIFEFRLWATFLTRLYRFRGSKVVPVIRPFPFIDFSGLKGVRSKVKKDFGALFGSGIWIAAPSVEKFHIRYSMIGCQEPHCWGWPQRFVPAAPANALCTTLLYRFEAENSLLMNDQSKSCVTSEVRAASRRGSQQLSTGGQAPWKCCWIDTVNLIQPGCGPPGRRQVP